MMKRQKNKLLLIAQCILALCMLALFASCGKNTQKNQSDHEQNDKSAEAQNYPEGKTPSQGLEFTSNGDGTCYVSGIGTCKDTDVVIPFVSPDGDTVTAIGKGYVKGWKYTGFSKCARITSVIIPNTVTSIGNYAFDYCSSLISIIIPENVKSIGICAFDGCSSLTNITIPNSVTSIGHQAFDDCDRLQYTVYNNAKYLGNTNNPYIVLMKAVSKSIVSCTIHPDTKFIYYGAFANCSSLTSITIPDGVTSIGICAFDDCRSLTSITIPDSVTSIGDQAFWSCDALTSIEIPNGVTSIGYGAFWSCDALTSIVIPDSVTSIATNAFLGCSSLLLNTYDNANYIGTASNPYFVLIRAVNRLITSVSVHPDTKVIQESAFLGCNELEYVNITDIANWCKIVSGDSPLYGRDLYINGRMANNLVIPNGVETIESNAFLGCKSLMSIEIPDSVTSIEVQTFSECKSLANITIPDSVTSIGRSAFSYCSKLTSITIPDSVTSIGDYAFNCCYSLTSITIPDSVTSIGDRAFEFCDALISIALGSGITCIDTKLISSTSLTNIEIPNSVTSIRDRAFQGCPSLKNIMFGGSEYEWKVIDKGNGNNWNQYSVIFALGSSQGLEYISNEDGTCYLSGIGTCTDTNLIIPSRSPAGDIVTGIGAGAFAHCKSLTGIEIPDSITSIGLNAFSDCPSLTNCIYAGTMSNWYAVQGGIPYTCETIRCTDGDIRRGEKYQPATMKNDELLLCKIAT